MMYLIMFFLFNGYKINVEAGSKLSKNVQIANKEVKKKVNEPVKVGFWQ